MELAETWLQDRIAEDPSILGLGEVVLLERERRQYKAGRLDLLLADVGGNTRYEVELMLGATNPDHIVRCLEYWDMEKLETVGLPAELWSESLTITVRPDEFERHQSIIRELAHKAVEEYLS